MAHWMVSIIGLDKMEKRKNFAPDRIRTPEVLPLAIHVTELSQFNIYIIETKIQLKSFCTTQFIIKFLLSTSKLIR
jgi:hypothetical protein